MSTVIDELVTILGINIKGSAMPMLHKFNSAIDSIGRYAGWASGALMAAAGSAAYFVERFTGMSTNIANFSQLTGVNSQTLQEWSSAVEQAGGHAEAFQQDIKNLTLQLNSPLPGVFNKGLIWLDVDLKKVIDAFDALEKMADSPKWKNAGASRQFQWGTEVGLSPDTIMYMQLDKERRAQLRQQARDLPVIVNDEQLQNAKEFTLQLNLLRQIFDYLGQTISSSAGPALRRIINDFSKWIKLNQEMIQSRIGNFIDGVIDGFGRFGKRIQEVISYLQKIFPWFGKLTEGLTETQVISDIVSYALLGLVVAFAMVHGTVIAGIAVFAALAVIMSDISQGFQGQTSLIGDWAKAAKEKAAEVYKDFSTKFPNIAKFIDLVSFALGKLAKLIKDDLVYGFKLMWEGLKPIYEALKWLVSVSLDKVFSGLDSMLEKVSPDLWKKLKDKIGSFVDEENPEVLQKDLDAIQQYNHSNQKPDKKGSSDLKSDLDAIQKYNKPSVSTSLSNSTSNSTTNNNAPGVVNQNNYIQIQRQQSQDDDWMVNKIKKATHPKSYLYPGGKAPAVQ